MVMHVVSLNHTLFIFVEQIVTAHKKKYHL